MRVHDMHQWKLEDFGAAFIGLVSGCFAYLRGVPFLNIGSNLVDLIWSCFVASCVGAAGWAGKKIIEENWKRVKAFIFKPFKRKPRA